MDTRYRIGKSGFTLLELLVVVAIIGVLAAISMAYLNESRNKGGDAAVKSNLVNARSQAEVYFHNQNRSYSGVCNNSATGIFRHVQGAARAYGITPKGSYTNSAASTWNTEECHDAIDYYVVWVPVPSSTSASPAGWCVDSRNATKVSSAVLTANATQCP